MPEHIFESLWWPLSLSNEEVEAFVAMKEVLQSSVPRDDCNTGRHLINLTGKTLESYLPRALASDRLPILCHMLLGLGDCSVLGTTLLREVATFLQRNADGRLVIAQCDYEGDIHPWQTLCYAVLSGISVNEPFGLRSDTSISAQVENCRRFVISDNTELGHLAVTWALLGLPSNATISVGGLVKDYASVVEAVVHGHIYGPFHICHKFHLTEAVLAGVAIGGIERYRSYAEAFMRAQLDMGVLLLCCVPDETYDWSRWSGRLDLDSTTRSLRTSLAIWDQIENYFNLVGHLLELAALASAMGFVIDGYHDRMLSLLQSRALSALRGNSHRLTLEHAFLGLCHLRRGAILWQVSRGRPCDVKGLLSNSALHTWRVSGVSGEDRSFGYTQLAGGAFLIGASDARLRPPFKSILSQVALARPRGLVPFGDYAHFRRLRPDRWPRKYHYEIMDDGIAFSMEFHLETADDACELLLKTIASGNSAMTYGGKWRWGTARLYTYLPSEPEEANAVACHFIESTFDRIDEIACMRAIAE